jgi:predicted transglutaminase-like cysteine proteinase
MTFVDDFTHWGVEDYWASPAEFVASGGGDCEDYALAKYYALKELGVPIARLRITYVKATRINQPHMILAYYQATEAEPLILDNLVGEILPAGQRPDLIPVYSFNDDDFWMARGGTSSRVGNAAQIRLWRGLQDKLQQERNM